MVSPLILIFNCITFALFWFVFRYNTLYVTKFTFDTGGLLFPKAINHMFTGLYVMEICLIGLFFLVEGVDNNGDTVGGVCIAQGVIMIILFAFTIFFHVILNYTFGPLVRYLPITLEDEAVARDEEFARVQGKRFNILDEEREGDDFHSLLERQEQKESDGAQDASEAIELSQIGNVSRSRHRLDPRSLARSAGDRLHAVAPPRVSNWASDHTRRQSSAWLYNPTAARDGNARFDELLKAHRLRRRLNMESGTAGDDTAGDGNEKKTANKFSAISDALFAGISEEIEDLSPEDRDFLVQRAFQHGAVRARRPIVWIPRDDLGISDDEIKRTRKFSKNVWISNQHTGLDSKANVIYRKSPPDFSEVDLIEL